MTDAHRRGMELALEQAVRALPHDVPVGAVILRGDEVVGVGYNRRELVGNALSHAEIEAIHAACTALGGWNLSGCTLYVTLEPCPMCAGAIAQARLDRVVYGAADPKAGALGSVCNLFAMPFPHTPYVTGGVLEQPCAALLHKFFAQLRSRNEGGIHI